jgi:uncharacterized spore protein YtfJ
MSLERMFDTLEGLRSTASVDAAFGQPQEVKGRTMISVSTVQVGMGLGFGQSVTEDAPVAPGPASGEPQAGADEVPAGSGGGGGARARPLAMIEVTPERTVVHPIVDETRVALAGIALGAWMFLLLYLTLRAIFGDQAE